MQIIDPSYIKKKAKYITLAIVYAIFAFWMLLNGEAFLGHWEGSWTLSILFYLVGVSLFLSIAEKLPTDLNKPISDSVFGFLIAFPAFTVVFWIIAQSGLYFQNIVPLPSYMVVPNIIYQTGIVATSEEIIFRGVIFRIFYRIRINEDDPPYIAYFVSSGLFAVFHYASYGGSFSAMFIAFIIGLLLAYLTEKYNIGTAIGFHASWNCFVIGATALIYLVLT